MQQVRSRDLRSTPVAGDIPVASDIPVANDDSDVMPDMPFEEGAHDAIDPDLRHRMISEAAYYLYTQRGYEEGYDVDDWLQAETQVDHIITNPDRGTVSDET
jgi:hypothetical protein